MRLKDKFAYIIIVCLIACLITMIVSICVAHGNLYKENDIIEGTIKEEEQETDETKSEVEPETTEPIIEIEPTVEETEPLIVETEPIVEIETEPIITEPIFHLSDYERQVVECMVMGESGAEPYEGQILVAQCILNACLKDGIQPSMVRKEYQYAGWHNKPSDSVKMAVSEVFDDGYKATEEFILYFYAPKHSSGRWHETQKFVIQVGGHKFFAEW